MRTVRYLFLVGCLFLAQTALSSAKSCSEAIKQLEDFKKLSHRLPKNSTVEANIKRLNERAAESLKQLESGTGDLNQLHADLANSLALMAAEYGKLAKEPRADPEISKAYRNLSDDVTKIAQDAQMGKFGEARDQLAKTNPDKESSSSSDGGSKQSLEATNIKPVEFWTNQKLEVKTTFADVGGLDGVKAAAEQATINRILNEDVYKYWFENAKGKDSAGGMVLYGPPGTGKTFIVQSLAGEIAKYVGANHVVVLAPSPADINGKWVGDAEGNVRNIFAAAKKLKAEGKHVIIFWDECEATVADPSKIPGDPVAMPRLKEWLAQANGLADAPGSGSIFNVGGTNEPWMVASSARRRMGQAIYVPLPDKATRVKILNLWLKKFPISSQINVDKLADMLDGYSADDVSKIVYQDAVPRKIASGIDPVTKIAGPKSREPLTQEDLENAIRARAKTVTSEDIQRHEAFRKEVANDK